MNKSLAISALLPVAFVMGSFGFPAATGQDKDKAPPVNLKAVIGVVDFDRLHQNFPEINKKFEDLRQERKKLEAEDKAKAAELQKLDEQRKALEPGTPDRFRADVGFRAALEAAQAFQQQGQEYLQLRLNTLRDHAFVELNKAVTDLAKKRGLQIVLRFRALPDAAQIEYKKVEARLQEHELRTVLYHAEELDLTEELIRIVKAAPPPAAASTQK
jgi:Skp family chaperone for outer membrane proteins